MAEDKWGLEESVLNVFFFFFQGLFKQNSK